MRMVVQGLCILLFCLWLANLVSAAEIKRKDGTLVVGEIQGVIVEKMVSLKKNKYFVAYIVANGKDVETIGERGMRTVQEISRLLLAGEFKQDKGLPDDLDVLTSLVTRNPFAAPNWGDLGWRVKPLSGGDRMVLTGEGNILGFAVPLARGGSFYSFYIGHIVKEESPDAKKIPAEATKKKVPDMVPVSDAVVGEFRMKGNAGQIVPMIEVNTANGMVTIPVADIVEFRRTEEPGSAEKK